MPLKKGQTNNTKGRPKGAKNLIGSGLRANISNFCNTNFNKIQSDFDSIAEPEKRIKLYIDFLKYVLPTLQVNKITKTIDDPEYLNWKRHEEKMKSMSEEERQERIERQLKEYQEIQKNENEELKSGF